MNARCPICRHPVAPSDAVAMGAFGRPWFQVHEGQCYRKTIDMLRSGAVMALGALRKVLVKKSPTALRVTEGVAIGMQIFKAQTEREGPRA